MNFASPIKNKVTIIKIKFGCLFIWLLTVSFYMNSVTSNTCKKSVVFLPITHQGVGVVVGIGVVDKLTYKLSAVSGYPGTKPERGQLDLHKSSYFLYLGLSQSGIFHFVFIFTKIPNELSSPGTYFRPLKQLSSFISCANIYFLLCYKPYNFLVIRDVRVIIPTHNLFNLFFL